MLLLRFLSHLPPLHLLLFLHSPLPLFPLIPDIEEFLHQPERKTVNSRLYPSHNKVQKGVFHSFLRSQTARKLDTIS